MRRRLNRLPLSSSLYSPQLNLFVLIAQTLPRM
jgi:hypothetical protein